MNRFEFEKMSDEDAAKAFIEMCRHFLVPLSKFGYIVEPDNELDGTEGDYQKTMFDVNNNITQLLDIESDSEIDLVDFARIFRRHPAVVIERIFNDHLDLEDSRIYYIERFICDYCDILSMTSDSLKSIAYKLNDMREADELAESMRMERD